MSVLKLLKLNAIKKRAADDLESLAKKIQRFEGTADWIAREFSLNDNLAELVEDISKKNNKNSFLYVFTADMPLAIYDKYKAFNSNNLKISKINNYDENKTKCLYVGSGKNCKSRLSQHLGITAKSNGTYSLHLKKVLGNKSNKVKFCIYVLPIGNDVDTSVMQVLEDSLWKMLSPCFGKLGGK